MKEAVRIIYATRDETKDKNVSLEMSWIGKETEGRHEIVPKDVASKVEEDVKKVMEAAEDDEDMDVTQHSQR